MIWCNKSYKIGIFKSNPPCSVKRKCCIEFSLFKLSIPYTRDKEIFITLYRSTMGNIYYPPQPVRELLLPFFQLSIYKCQYL